jgi:hypothetical protein
MAKKSWPYPVLDADCEDYPNCAFQAAVDMRQTRTEFIGDVRMDLGSATLQKVINDGNAAFAVQIHCPRTSHRQILKSTDKQFKFTLPEGTLRDDFTVQPFVVAEKPLVLSSPEFAPTFSKMNFNIERGYVLAIAPQVMFVAEKRLDDLRSVRAIFFITKAPKEAKAVEFDFNQDRIGIVLPEQDFNLYNTFRNTPPYPQLFLCSLVLPALHQALVILRGEAGDETFGQRWKRVLRRCLKENGESDFEVDRAFEVAQKLLEMPIARALAAIDAKESDA